MGELEEQVKLLKKEKAIAQIQNAELKKQNQYWMNLFQNMNVMRSSTNAPSSVSGQPQSIGGIIIPQSQAQPKSVAYQAEEQENQPAFNDLEKSRDAFLKRPKVLERDQSFFNSVEQKPMKIDNKKIFASFCGSEIFADDVLANQKTGVTYGNTNNTSFFNFPIVGEQRIWCCYASSNNTIK